MLVKQMHCVEIKCVDLQKKQTVKEINRATSPGQPVTRERKWFDGSVTDEIKTTERKKLDRRLSTRKKGVIYSVQCGVGGGL